MMGQDRPAKASPRLGGEVENGAAEQAQHNEPAQKKSKPARQKAPSALSVVKGTLERNAKLAKVPSGDDSSKHSGGPSGNAKQASVVAKGSAEKAKKEGSRPTHRPAKVGAGPSLEPGTPLLPTRKGSLRGADSPADTQAPTEAACTEMEALSSAAAAFEEQKQLFRQSKTPSAKGQGPKQRGTSAAPSSEVQADDLVKMVVGAALTGQQPEALAGQSTQDLQNHLIGSFFAGPGFQLPPTPEALPLPSSSLLQRLASRDTGAGAFPRSLLTNQGCITTVSPGFTLAE